MLKKVILFLCVLAMVSFARNNEIEADDSASETAMDESIASSSDVTAEESVGRETESESSSDFRSDDRAQRKQFEQDQRLDEYANSLRRRDWLKDRLVFQLGMGSRQPVMGETGMGMGFGFGAEYITAWHLGLYGSFGFISSGNDADFDGIKIEGGTGWKAGLNYYLFPKNPLHLGLSASYGTVYYDHDIVADATNDFTRELITTMGYQFDVLVTYLTDEWYFLQFSVGMYYAPNAHDDSFKTDVTTGEETSRVVDKDGISKWGLVFGITIGFALPEFFPDDTEKRRREREKRSND